MTKLPVVFDQAAPIPVHVLNKGGSLIAGRDTRLVAQGDEGEATFFAEFDSTEIAAWLTSFDTDRYYARSDVFELMVDTQANDGVNWNG
ncbi:hypothetical protein [Erythrobacter sp.]|uniref:hypothetical protein n=1 Tax=Erythrobacter sp. TaxID=1042 RepID=UPI0025EEB302|nr:hypothetical protein [Erythrobacter sp.]